MAEALSAHAMSAPTMLTLLRFVLAAGRWRPVTIRDLIPNPTPHVLKIRVSKFLTQHFEQPQTTVAFGKHCCIFKLVE